MTFLAGSLSAKLKGFKLKLNPTIIFEELPKAQDSRYFISELGFLIFLFLYKIESIQILLESCNNRSVFHKFYDIPVVCHWEIRKGYH